MLFCIDRTKFLPNRIIPGGVMTSWRFSRWQPSVTATFDLLYDDGRPPVKWNWWSQLLPQISAYSYSFGDNAIFRLWLFSLKFPIHAHFRGFLGHIPQTSNVTSVTEVRSASFGLVLHAQHIFMNPVNCLVRGAPWWVLLQHAIMLRQLFFTLECGVARFLCAMRVFEVRASSSPLGYICAKFRFFRGPHCWTSPWRIVAYSINHSRTHALTSLFDAPGTEARASE